MTYNKNFKIYIKGELHERQLSNLQSNLAIAKSNNNKKNNLNARVIVRQLNFI